MPWVAQRYGAFLLTPIAAYVPREATISITISCRSSKPGSLSCVLCFINRIAYIDAINRTGKRIGNGEFRNTTLTAAHY